jgi:hypothetical protein
MKVQSVMRRRGSHNFSRHSTCRWRWSCQPYTPAALYLPGRFLIIISVRGLIDPRAILRLEVLGKLKNQRPHRESNPRSSGLSHSASTNYVIVFPLSRVVQVIIENKRVIKIPKFILVSNFIGIHKIFSDVKYAEGQTGLSYCVSILYRHAAVV